ncbi:unnamed protein product [Rotaria sp. Silwood2]|nr:unnamed protein product [Rotaria sp. Silwood2]CAF3378496.1 unnamed protein product [Rotaria sp. Silwood2]CAF4310391.1 unnamed protein product [Rotaria sp. Silwood2]CAF4643857.1 unnamed protein product [Rotaria sp. Silwood2]
MSLTSPMNPLSQSPTTSSNDFPVTSQEIHGSSTTSTPAIVLPGQILTQADHEDNLIEAMDGLIKDFLTRSNQPSPYHTVFRWICDDERYLHYSVVVAINEPSHLI